MDLLCLIILILLVLLHLYSFSNVLIDLNDNAPPNKGRSEQRGMSLYWDYTKCRQDTSDTPILNEGKNLTRCPGKSRKKRSFSRTHSPSSISRNIDHLSYFCPQMYKVSPSYSGEHYSENEPTSQEWATFRCNVGILFSF